MKTLIIQALIPNASLNEIRRGIYETCCTTIKRYAKNIGSDYILERSPFFRHLPPHFDVFRIMAEKRFLQYDKILFIDADVFALDTEENVFEYYDGFCACKNPGGKTHRPEYQISPDFLNSGIIFFNQKTISTLKPHYQQEMKRCARTVPGRDQLALNKLAYNILGGYKQINSNHACYLRDDEAQEAILVHLAGQNRQIYLADKEKWDAHFKVSV